MKVYKGIFSPDAGTVQGPVECGTCGTHMEVKRDVIRATSFAEAMSGRKHLVDEFQCPYNDKDWHRQVEALWDAIRNTPSGRLAKIMQEEIVEILATQQETKEDGYFSPERITHFDKEIDAALRAVLKKDS